MSGALERTGVWDQPDVTAASSFETPLDEYVAWIEDNSIEVVLCDQNYQFDELAELRARGVRVIGRFVWEHFTEDHLEPARAAYDVVYSVTECERERYRGWGLETPRVPWGIHPELLEVPVRRSDDGIVRFVFPGGFLGHRKPAEPVIEAFSRARGEHLRLTVKAQVERTRLKRILPLVEADERIELRLADEPWHEHLAAIAAHDVSISPSRWEGLGLPLYEAVAFGMPTIANDDPPMNEVVTDGDNGLLVPSHPDGTARSRNPRETPRHRCDGDRDRAARGALDPRAPPRRGGALTSGPFLGADARRIARAADELTGRAGPWAVMVAAGRSRNDQAREPDWRARPRDAGRGRRAARHGGGARSGRDRSLLDQQGLLCAAVERLGSVRPADRPRLRRRRDVARRRRVVPDAGDDARPVPPLRRGPRLPRHRVARLGPFGGESERRDRVEGRRGLRRLRASQRRHRPAAAANRHRRAGARLGRPVGCVDPLRLRRHRRLPGLPRGRS